MLRKGQRDNPTKRHLELLASFFQVPPTYFFDDDASRRIEAELDLLGAVRNDDLRRLATRANGLSAKSLAGLVQMVDVLRDLEGLPTD